MGSDIRQTRTGGRAATKGVIPGRYALSVGKPSTPPPDGWRWVPLSDVARLETGHTPSRRHPEYWDGDVPWVGIADATENHGRVIQDTKQHVTELGIAHSSARMLPANTVCLSRTASVGYVVVMGRPMATSQDFVDWVCSSELDYRFLKYVLLAEHHTFLRFASGTTHQTVYFPEVKAFHICLPPIKEQRRIADLLGALDDKIELNRRMSETLESMARALFKSWFVDFDPVRAKAEGRGPGLPKFLGDLFPDSVEDSELGEVPKGWEIHALGDHVTNLDSKRIPVSGRERAKRQGRYPYHGAAGIMDYVDSFLFDGVMLLVGEDGSVVNGSGTAVTQYVWGRFWVNNHAHVLQGRGSVSTEQLYLYFGIEPVLPYVTGAVQPKLSQGRMNSMPFLYPGESICRAFAELVTPVFSDLRSRLESIKTESALRDALLPPLLSGQAGVSLKGKEVH
jgi:type I restriction enzyme S subunit